NNGTPTAAVHGGLTVVHGGGNSPLLVKGTFNVTGSAGANQILRTDGLNWADYEFAVGQQVTLSGVTGTRLVTAITGSTLTVAGDDRPRQPALLPAGRQPLHVFRQRHHRCQRHVRERPERATAFGRVDRLQRAGRRHHLRQPGGRPPRRWLRRRPDRGRARAR